MSKALKTALTRREKANDDVTSTLKRDYPIGSGIHWRRNGLHAGSVLRHGYGDQIQVKNHRTGRSPWIDAFSIVEAMGKS